MRKKFRKKLIFDLRKCFSNVTMFLTKKRCQKTETLLFVVKQHTNFKMKGKKNYIKSSSLMNYFNLL